MRNLYKINNPLKTLKILFRACPSLITNNNNILIRNKKTVIQYFTYNAKKLCIGILEVDTVFSKLKF